MIRRFRSTTRLRHARRAYTLLEVLLSLAIAVMLLAAVYSTIGYQLRQAQAGRDLVEQSTLARSILNKVAADITDTLTLADAARFRRQASSSGGAASGGGASGMTTGMTATTPPATGTTPATGAATGGATSSTGSSSTGASTSTETMPQASSTPVSLPLGVIGSATEIHLFVSKVPPVNLGDMEQLTSDLMRISYWLDGETGGGMCRMEERMVTSEQGQSIELPRGDIGQFLLAPEAKSLEFEYFDGTSWTDSWDSTQLGQDQATPIGSPRAIAVKLGLESKRGDGAVVTKYYRHVIFIPTAGGTPLETTTSTTTGGGATTP